MKAKNVSCAQRVRDIYIFSFSEHILKLIRVLLRKKVISGLCYLVTVKVIKCKIFGRKNKYLIGKVHSQLMANAYIKLNCKIYDLMQNINF